MDHKYKDKYDNGKIIIITGLYIFYGNFLQIF